MRWLPTLTGLLATAAALIVLAAQPASPPESPSVQATVQAVEPAPSAVIVETPILATAQGTPDLLPGLPEAVAAVLGESGYAAFATDAEIRGSLSQEVVRTLVSNGAVLVVPESGPQFGGM